MPAMYYSRKELADLLGISSAYIKTYVNRGKLVPHDEKAQWFDYYHEDNKAFIDARMPESKQESGNEAKDQSETEAPEPEPEPPPTPDPGNVNEPSINDTLSDEEDILRPPKLNNKTATEAWKKKLEAYLTKSKIEISQLQKQKLLGNNLPKDAVEMLMSQMIKNYVEGFKELAENIINEMAAIKKLTPEESGKLRKQLIEAINEQSKKAGEQAKRDLRSIIANSQETRSKGESKTTVRNDQSQ